LNFPLLAFRVTADEFLFKVDGLVGIIPADAAGDEDPKSCSLIAGFLMKPPNPWSEAASRGFPGIYVETV
jgi:hypothetical protein